MTHSRMLNLTPRLHTRGKSEAPSYCPRSSTNTSNTQVFATRQALVKKPSKNENNFYKMVHGPFFPVSGTQPIAGLATVGTSATLPEGDDTNWLHFYKDHPANTPCLLYVGLKCTNTNGLQTSTEPSARSCATACEVSVHLHFHLLSCLVTSLERALLPASFKNLSVNCPTRSCGRCTVRSLRSGEGERVHILCIRHGSDGQ